MAMKDPSLMIFYKCLPSSNFIERCITAWFQSPFVEANPYTTKAELFDLYKRAMVKNTAILELAFLLAFLVAAIAGPSASPQSPKDMSALNRRIEFPSTLHSNNQ